MLLNSGVNFRCLDGWSVWLSGRSSPTLCERARVAEWQTRWLQVPVSERAWGFKSPLAHREWGVSPTKNGVSSLTAGHAVSSPERACDLA